MNEKQKRFVAEYLIDLNGTQAAIRAGYSPHTANEQSSRLLADVNIQEAVAKGQKRIADKLDITAERVLREIALSAFANMDDFTKLDGATLRLDLSGTNRDQRAAISELTQDTISAGDEDSPPVIRTKIKLYDRQRGLELLGRHLKLFTERAEIGGLDGGPLELSIKLVATQQ